MNAHHVNQKDVKPLPIPSLFFRGVPYELPEGTVAADFCRASNGGYQINYTVEQHDDNGSVIMPYRKRKVVHNVYLNATGNEEARCVSEFDWEADNPSAMISELAGALAAGV